MRERERERVRYGGEKHRERKDEDKRSSNILFLGTVVTVYPDRKVTYYTAIPPAVFSPPRRLK